MGCCFPKIPYLKPLPKTLNTTPPPEFIKLGNLATSEVVQPGYIMPYQS